jgi:hypothetical protein
VGRRTTATTTSTTTAATTTATAATTTTGGCGGGGGGGGDCACKPRKPRNADSHPSMSGISQSMSTRSKAKALATYSSSASCPLAAQWYVWPPDSR